MSRRIKEVQGVVKVVAFSSFFGGGQPEFRNNGFAANQLESLKCNISNPIFFLLKSIRSFTNN